MTSSLDQIEALRKELTLRVLEVNGDLLDPTVIQISSQLDKLILEYLKANSKPVKPTS